MPTQAQIDQKIRLIDIASRLTSISLPVGSTEPQIQLQLERWYQSLNSVDLPDETVFTSPVMAVPTPSNANQNPASQIAAAVAPALSSLPGAAGQVASGVANAIANLPLQTLVSAPIAAK